MKRIIVLVVGQFPFFMHRGIKGGKSRRLQGLAAIVLQAPAFGLLQVK